MQRPELTEFLAGYAGPAALDFRAGKVKVIAAIVYADGVAIEWAVGPAPDLSWMPAGPEEESSKFFPQFRDQPEALERMRRFKKLTTFWETATLDDDLGTRYRWTGGEAGGQEDVGYKGREIFSPGPPAGARELTVRVSKLAITIALEQR